jgi:hypothetical protein
MAKPPAVSATSLLLPYTLTSFGLERENPIIGRVLLGEMEFISPPMGGKHGRIWDFAILIISDV